MSGRRGAVRVTDGHNGLTCYPGEPVVIRDADTGRVLQAFVIGEDGRLVPGTCPGSNQPAASPEYTRVPGRVPTLTCPECGAQAQALPGGLLVEHFVKPSHR